jgi:hypothetical protein
MVFQNVTLSALFCGIVGIRGSTMLHARDPASRLYNLSPAIIVTHCCCKNRAVATAPFSTFATFRRFAFATIGEASRRNVTQSPTVTDDTDAICDAQPSRLPVGSSSESEELSQSATSVPVSATTTVTESPLRNCRNCCKNCQSSMNALIAISDNAQDSHV